MHYDSVAAVTTGRFEGSTNSHTLKTVSRDSFDKESASYSDGLGRTIESEDELGNLSFSIYDNNGSPRKVRDANGVGQDCDLDLRGRDILCKDTHGDVTKTVYDANSNVINIEDGKAQVLAADTVYDARDRVIAQTTRLSVDDVTKFTYDKNSNQREIADADALKAAAGDFAAAAKTIYSYDTRNLKISTAYPGHNASSAVGASDYDLTMCTYDAAMRKLVQTDQKGDTQAHLYDMANRLEERQYRTYAQSGTIGTDGIPTGSIASDIESNAQADFDTFEYDLASRTTKAKKGRYLNVIDYTYDDGGRMVDETITVNTTPGAGKSYSMLHDFDSDSRMTRCTYPDGSKKTNFFTERDEVDKTFYQGNLVADMAYDAGYRETSRTFGNNLVSTKTYNADNTYSSITVAGKTGLSFDYTYDANKNVLSETTGSPMAGYSWTSTYDAKDRLKTWDRTNTVDSQSWDLSEAGDWKSNTVNGTTTARGHNAVHEIGNVGASNLTHDAKGNTTTDELGRVLNWDFENKLQSSDASSAGGSSSIGFTYDALGRRITKDDTLYVYCGQKVCAEYDVGANASNLERKFIYSNYVDEPLMLVNADGAGSDVDEYYYHCNRQYSVTGLTDDTGAVVERYAYAPYGQTTILAANGTTVRTSSSYGNPYMYTGRRIDLEFSGDPETAMYYFRARYYSPTLGRFVGRDPLGYVDGYSLYAGYFASKWGVDPLGNMSGAGGQWMTPSSAAEAYENSGGAERAADRDMRRRQGHGTGLLGGTAAFTQRFAESDYTVEDGKVIKSLVILQYVPIPYKTSVYSGYSGRHNAFTGRVEKIIFKMEWRVVLAHQYSCCLEDSDRKASIDKLSQVLRSSVEVNNVAVMAQGTVQLGETMLHAVPFGTLADHVDQGKVGWDTAFATAIDAAGIGAIKGGSVVWKMARARRVGKGYRVMSSNEYKLASKGKWADSDLVKGDPTESGHKWLWGTKEEAISWQEFLAKYGEEGIITEVPTKKPLGSYPSHPHPPQGTAHHVPIDDLGPAKAQ